MDIAEPVPAGRTTTAGGVIGWALTGFLLYVVLGLVTLLVALTVVEVVADAIGANVESGSLGLSVRNAFHPLAWGLSVAAVSLPLGRRLVPGLESNVTAWTILVVGLLFAAGTDLLATEFVRERYGSFDADMQGWTAFTTPALVALALAAWATLSVPRGRGVPLVVVTAAAALALVASLAPSVPGLEDGVTPSSVPLAIVLAGAGAYSVLAVVATIRHGLGLHADR